MIVFHQYGARRTGTNYTQALLEENFSNIIVLDNITWKHDPIPKEVNFYKSWIENPEKHYIKTCAQRFDLYKSITNILEQDQLKTIVNIKDPYAWIESLWRYTQNVHLIKADERNSKYLFLDCTESIINQQDNLIQTIQTYNDRYNSWCRTTDHVLRYEDMLINHEAVLNYFRQAYDLAPVFEHLMNIKTGCDPMPINLKTIMPDWNYADYYLNKKYLKNLPSNIIEIVTENIDWSLFGAYGYEPI